MEIGELAELGDFGEFMKGADFTGGAELEARFNAKVEALNDAMPKDVNVDMEIKVKNGKVEIISNGEPVDMEVYNDALTKGNFEGALKELHVPDEVLDTPEVKELSAKFEDQVKRSATTKMSNELNETIDDGENVRKEAGGDPKTPEEMKEMVDKMDGMEKKLDELRKKLEEDAKGKKGIEVGKWVKRTLIGIFVIAGLEELFHLIKEHQDAMNGCWLIDRTSGNKCKVSIMTCSSGERNNGNKCSGTDTSGCGIHNDTACFNTDTCVKYKPLAKGQKNQDCATKLSQCTSGHCSKYCDCSKIPCPKGKYLRCVNVGFWEAAGDFLKDPLGLTSGLENMVIKLLKYGFFILLALLVVYIAFKGAQYMLTRRSGYQPVAKFRMRY